jgi:predicted ABC-type ATPase
MAKKRAKPRCLIIAGPNGAGKTTFARDYLPGIAGLLHFINAGGHDVPRADVIRRFKRGWSNFRSVYRPLADRWANTRILKQNRN